MQSWCGGMGKLHILRFTRTEVPLPCFRWVFKQLTYLFPHPRAPHCPPFSPSPQALLGFAAAPSIPDTQDTERSHRPALKVCTLLSRDSKASEVEDLELFMPEGVPGSGRMRSGPWLPALATGLQGLVALRMMSWGDLLSVEGWKGKHSSPRHYLWVTW